MRNKRLFTFIASYIFLDLHSLDNIVIKSEELKQDKSNSFNETIIIKDSINNNKYINKSLRNYKIK